MRGSKKRERGQAMILIVFSIIGILGMSALAIDGGNAYVDRRKTETAASAAALTASITRIEGSDWRAAALATARTNGYDNNGITNTVELNTPPLSGPYVGNSEYIEVIITSHLSTYFGVVIGIPQVTSIAHAVSQSKPAEYGQMFDGYAVVSLAPHSDCEHKVGFVIYEEATINLIGGGLFVNSDNSLCAFMSYGSGSVRVKDDSPITVVGGEQIQKTQLITPYPIQIGAVPLSYPPALQMPKAGCGSKNSTVDLLTGVMTSGNTPGGDFPPEGVDHLQGGVYCIDGDFILDDGRTLTGEGVLLMVADGQVKISGSAIVHLSASSSGPAPNLLLYLPMKNKSIVSLGGSSDSSYKGTIFAPAADIRITGPSSFSGGNFRSQIIGYYVQVKGQNNIVVMYNDDQNYDAFKMPEVILSQ
jgi:Putative Flp pilus-assembly TadE/G-like